jgi:uncharacterized damage-inducible protein DinB
MDAADFIRRQIAAVRRQVGAVLRDTTDEQLNWVPPGTANTIGATYLHLLTSEDGYVQAVILGRPRVWETGNWSETIGLSAPPGRGRNWDEIRSMAFSLAALQAYEQAVHATTETYLAALIPTELDRTVAFIGGERPVADVLASLVVHSMGHAGEIAALKGMQGVKGLPF